MIYRRLSRCALLVPLLFSLFAAPLLSPQAVRAGEIDETEIEIPPAVSILLRNDFAGIAGPAGDTVDFWDELPLPAVLVGDDDLPKYHTWIKLNVGDASRDLDGVRNEEADTAVARYEEVESGTYRACIPLTAPLVVSEAHCTAPFSYTEGQNYVGELTITMSLTVEQIAAAQAFGINDKPCSGSHIGWIVCPIAEELFDTVRTLTLDVFRGLLELDPLDNQAAEGTAEAAIFNIWNSFRVIATVMFVAIFLVVVFGSGLAGFQAFSAYDIKKMLPRLVIAMIGIQLSWYISGFLVDLFNLLGGGVRGLILAPVEGLDLVEFDAGRIGTSLTVFVITGGLVSSWLAVGGILGIVFLIPIIFINVLMALVFGLVVMLLRNALVLLGVIFSPVALALWVLPNTQSLFDFWWNAMWRLLVMYPLVIALIAIGELTAKLVVASNEGSLLWSIVAMVVMFMPFFLIPYTFRVAQNIIGSVTTGLDGQRRLVNERLFGSPEDEFSYRARQRNRRERYSTQRLYKSYNKHFINPGKAGRVGLKPLPFMGKVPGVRRLKIRPGVVPRTDSKAPNVRTTWRRGGYGNTGAPVDLIPGLQGKEKRQKEGLGDYLKSLPRFALRMPGRAWAKANARGRGFVGLPGIDEAMGIRNREARDRIQRMEKMGSRDAFAHAMFGDFNLFTGERLDGDVIQAAKGLLGGDSLRNDDAIVQESMKWLMNKAAGIPYRRQLLRDHWMGRGHPLIDATLQKEWEDRGRRGKKPAPHKYENEHLQPMIMGMIKGVDFGTKRTYGETNNNPTVLKRRPDAADRQDQRSQDEIAPDEDQRGKLQPGSGHVDDGGINAFMNELTNNVQDRNLTALSGNIMIVWNTAQGRVHDLFEIEAARGLAERHWIESEQRAGRTPTKDEIKEFRDTRVDQYLHANKDIITGEYSIENLFDTQMMIEGDQETLRSMQQSRALRISDLEAISKDKNNPRAAAAKAELERQREVAKARGHTLQEFDYVYNEHGGLIFDYDENQDARSAKDLTGGREWIEKYTDEDGNITNEGRLVQKLKQTADTREALLDVLAQGDIGIELGDDDKQDSLKPETGLSELARGWRLTAVAEYDWIKNVHGGEVPDQSVVREWRQKHREGYVKDNRERLEGIQKDRVENLIKSGSTAAMAENTLRQAKTFLRNSDWSHDRKTLERYVAAGVMSKATMNDILRDR